MASKREVEKFVKSHRSIRLYKKVQTALKDVLSAIPDKDYKKATRNLKIMVLHEGALGQVMHFPSLRDKFKVLQLTFPRKIPLNVLKFVIAHELGHAMQGRNWRKGEGMRLETDADKRAANWGFAKTSSIAKWMENYKSHNIWRER